MEVRIIIGFLVYLFTDTAALPELALLHRSPRAATVRAVVKPGQPKLKVAALDADAFTRLLGPLRDLMERSATQMYQARS